MSALSSGPVTDRMIKILFENDRSGLCAVLRKVLLRIENIEKSMASMFCGKCGMVLSNKHNPCECKAPPKSEGVYVEPGEGVEYFCDDGWHPAIIAKPKPGDANHLLRVFCGGVTTADRVHRLAGKLMTKTDHVLGLKGRDDCA